MNIQGIQGDYVFGRGLVFAKFPGNDYFEELGDTDAVEVKVEAERDDRMDNRFGVSRLADSTVTKVTVTVSMTLMQFTLRNRALAVMGDLGYMSQSAAVGTVKTFATVKAFQAYELGAFNVTNVVVTDGAAATYVLGTDYAVDSETGIVQPLKDLAVIEVTFDQPEITNAAKRLKVGIGGNPDIRCELLVVGTNSAGQRAHLRLWDVRVTPSNGRGYISTDRSSVELEGAVMANQAKGLAAGDGNAYAFGIEQTLAAAA